MEVWILLGCLFALAAAIRFLTVLDENRKFRLRVAECNDDLAKLRRELDRARTDLRIAQDQGETVIKANRTLSAYIDELNAKLARHREIIQMFEDEHESVAETGSVDD